MARRRRRTKKRFAQTALLVCYIHLAVFTVAQTVIAAVTGVEQTELINMTFTVFGIEIGGLLAKRIIEKIFQKKTDEEE